MSQLELYFGLSALWLALAWMPYILDRIMVRGLIGAMDNPSPDLAPQSAWAQRAKAAHAVGVESFVVFGPVAVFTMMKLPDSALAGTLAMLYFFGLVGHYIVYALGIIVIRTLVFAVATLSSALMILHVMGWI